MMRNELPNGISPSDNGSRYRRGLDILLGLSREKMDIVSNRLAEVAPDFARLVIEYAFGELFAREGLDMRSRELIAIAVLTARGDSLPPLRAHIASALKVGATGEQVIEAMMQVSIYSGFPVVIQALTGCHDLLTDAADPLCLGCPGSVQGEGLGQS